MVLYLCRRGAAQIPEPPNHKAKEYREMNINPLGPYYAGALRTAIASCFINGKIKEQQIEHCERSDLKVQRGGD